MVTLVLGLILLTVAIAFASSSSPVALTSEGHLAVAVGVISGVMMVLSALVESAARKRRAAARISGPREQSSVSSAALPKCPRCGNEVEDEYVVCPYCGLTLTMQCTACGKPLRREFTVCPYCGHKLEESGGPPPMPTPSAEKPREVAKRGSRRRRVLVAVLATLIVIAGAGGVLWALSSRPVSAEENARLWTRAHTALFGFVSESMKAFGSDEASPATDEQLSLMSQYLRDFNAALRRLARVTPPVEQAVLHRALLPVYQEMGDHMAGLKEALRSGDAARAEIEWHYVASLLDRVAGVAEVLTLERR